MREHGPRASPSPPAEPPGPMRVFPAGIIDGRPVCHQPFHHLGHTPEHEPSHPWLGHDRDENPAWLTPDDQA